MIGIIVPAGPVKVAMLPGCRIGAHVSESGVFEPESLAAWSELVKPDTWAIDVGCYTGLYAIAAAKRGAKVFAFEPMPKQRQRIHENAKLNKVEINVTPAAASDKSGIGTLHFNPNVDLTSGASFHSTGAGSCNVVTATIDALPCKPVSAIKIDAERHEEAVIRGAAMTIARDLPGLIVECLDDRHRNAIIDLVSKTHRLAAVLDYRNLLLMPISK